MDVIVSKTGKKIPQIKATPRTFIDKTIVFYGPTGSGKTVAAQHIMNLLKDSIDICLVVCPTELVHHTYEPIVGLPYIHYSLTLDPTSAKSSPSAVKDAGLNFIEEIKKKQEAAMTKYGQFNDLDTLTNLIHKLPKKVFEQIQIPLHEIDKKRKKLIEEIRLRNAKDLGKFQEEVDQVKAQILELMRLLFKKFIRENIKELEHCRLTKEEQDAIDYIDFNPRMLLVFDDCAAEMKALMKTPSFRKLFYQGRHLGLTTMFLCQDDTDMDANLRKNAYISIFCSPEVCSANFERQSNNYGKELKQLMPIISREVIVAKQRSLLYIRDDKMRQNVYAFSPKVPPKFRFGCEAAREFADEVKGNGRAAGNPYYKDF